MEQYYMVEEVLENEETGTKYCCYGVGIGEQKYGDLCLEKPSVQEFVRRLNDEGLEQIHLEGAVEDFVQSLDAEKK